MGERQKGYAIITILVNRVDNYMDGCIPTTKYSSTAVHKYDQYDTATTSTSVYDDGICSSSLMVNQCILDHDKLRIIEGVTHGISHLVHFLPPYHTRYTCCS